MEPLVVATDDPRRDDIRALLVRHLAFANEHSPPEDVHALDLDGLVVPGITFCSARRGGVLVGIGALKDLGGGAGELKSMHTAAEERGRGAGGVMVDHLVGLARERSLTTLYLETGSMAAFAPARSLYARAGFAECGHFADYVASRNSTFMTLALDELF